MGLERRFQKIRRHQLIHLLQKPHCRKIIFSPVDGIRFGQLFLNIVPTLEINSQFPKLDQHLTDRHSWQSVMISAWERVAIIIVYFKKFFWSKYGHFLIFLGFEQFRILEILNCLFFSSVRFLFCISLLFYLRSWI